jgi:hypothetical protein
MYVIKRSGQQEEFDPSKTRAAVMRAGVSLDEADRILELLMPRLFNGITTEEIYRQVNKMLDAQRRLRFGLKKSIIGLGPEGYYFEDFISRLFQEMGYDVKVRQTLQGACVQHEIDVLLQKGDSRGMVECKFHNSQGMKCSIQTVLYTYGRFLDVSATADLESIWLVTNTRFSSDVVQYAKCMNIELMGMEISRGE